MLKNNIPLLEMKKITKEFPGVVALDRVNFRLKPHSVHALMGENGAGKSTLMKCLFGIYKKDKGNIFLCGEEVEFGSSKEALDNGVSMVHQELNLVLERSVMDNIWLGRYPLKGLFIDEKKMYQKTKKIFKELEIDINPKEKVSNLSVSQMQMIEIAKAFSYNAKVIVMDEPTSSLTEKEVLHLFKIIKKLKERGCGIIYISHKMEEIKEISDEITIFRDGKWIATEKVKKLSIDEIINLMVGRDLTHRFPEKTNIIGESVLEVKNLTAANKHSIKEISFEMYKGEILGVAGLVGSKRTELLETIFGMREFSQGEIILHGEKIKNKNPHEAIKNGFALVTEERRATGLFPMLNLIFNSTISNINLEKYKNKYGFLDEKIMQVQTNKVIERMKVKAPSQKSKIENLSGGNQQKVILGRWLETEPEILMLDEPTRGIDVGAKYEIYQLIINLAQKGKSVLMISSEMPELLGITDRIIVMSNGRIVDVVKTLETSQEEILALTSKYL